MVFLQNWPPRRGGCGRLIGVRFRSKAVADRKCSRCGLPRIVGSLSPASFLNPDTVRSSQIHARGSIQLLACIAVLAQSMECESPFLQMEGTQRGARSAAAAYLSIAAASSP